MGRARHQKEKNMHDEKAPEGAHSHDHGHSHGGDGHGHTHSHSRPESGEGSAHANALEGRGAGNKEMETLKALLGHWADHNDSHVESYREWAGKARANGNEEAALLLESALADAENVTKALLGAKEKI
jgi:hypothetical protein